MLQDGEKPQHEEINLRLGRGLGLHMEAKTLKKSEISALRCVQDYLKNRAKTWEGCTKSLLRGT